MMLEHGSSIEYASGGLHFAPDLSQTASVATGVFFASARQALATLARGFTGLARPRRILLPDHYCHATSKSVISAVERFATRIELYASPFGVQAEIATEASDMVVVNATFGGLPSAKVFGSGVVVLDVSHSPDQILGSGSVLDSAPCEYDYVIASLKKLLPLTDGGAIRAGPGRRLPPSPDISPAHESACAELEQLLQLKHDYLHGCGVQKSRFYPKIRALEQELASRDEAAAMSRRALSRLAMLDVDASVKRARANVRVFRREFDLLAGDERRRPELLQGETTFIAITAKSSREKEALASSLIADRIWPATLWPTDGMTGISDATRDFVARLVVLNADARYGDSDMRDLARRVWSAAERSAC